MRASIVALWLLLPTLVRAQADTTGRGEVYGTVYDSVARRPVVGAVVQIVSATNIATQAYSAVTDERGRYVVTGMTPGSYISGFHHSALDSLALEPPLRRLTIAAGKRVRLDLAVPSARTIVTAFCGHDGTADSTGVLLGVMRDARTNAFIDSGTVQARWQDLVLDRPDSGPTRGTSRARSSVRDGSCSVGFRRTSTSPCRAGRARTPPES
jgi:hypothetical protein